MQSKRPSSARKYRSQFGERRSLDLQARPDAAPMLDLRPYGDTSLRASEHIIDLSEGVTTDYLRYDERA